MNKFRVRNLPAHILSALASGRHFRPKATYHGETEQVLVLNRTQSFSIEIYIRPRLQNSELAVTYVDFPDSLPDEKYFTKRTFVIISRYINEPWCEALKRYRNVISGVAYLMDDNIPEAGFDHTLPAGYALGLASFFYKYCKRLEELCSELWLTSTYLVNRYHGPVTSLIDPLFVSKPRSAYSDDRYLTIFYHAQMPHYQDNLWLRYIINIVQQQYEHTVFETFGGEIVRRAYQHIPRSRVLKRFTWGDYLDYCAGLSYDIGLAPLNNGIFNRARSINKLFDICRCGAAGIYSDLEPYSAVIDNGKTGILCNHTKNTWIEVICELIDNKTLRKSISRHCRHFCETHNKQAITPESLKSLM